ncbi:MAG: FtsX-like permease family protein [Lachnotalea sp.]
MKFKIFTKILFEKKRILILYILMIIFALTFLNMRLISMDNDLKQSNVPDIIIKGKMDEDGVLKYKYYNGIPELASQLSETLASKAKVYGIVTRSMMTDRDPLTNNYIEYTIYGVPNDFLKNELNDEMTKGNLPEEDKNQAIMGNYAQNYYNVNVEDKIEQPITLNSDWQKNDIGLYTLSGVLSNNLEYFKGAIILSKDTFKNKYQNVDDNIVYIYVDNKEAYEQALAAVQEIKMNDTTIGTITMNFYAKQYTIRNAFIGCISIALISVVFILLLIAYLMKGTTVKIGILKALGLPNRTIILTFNGGIFITLLLSSLLSLITTYITTILFNQSLSNFLGYKVIEYNVNSYCVFADVGFVLLCFLVSYMHIYRINNKTLPKEAMAKN